MSGAVCLIAWRRRVLGRGSPLGAPADRLGGGLGAASLILGGQPAQRRGEGRDGLVRLRLPVAAHRRTEPSADGLDVVCAGGGHCRDDEAFGESVSIERWDARDSQPTELVIGPLRCQQNLRNVLDEPPREFAVRTREAQLVS